MVPILLAHPVGWVLLALVAGCLAVGAWYAYLSWGALAAWAVGAGAVVALAAVSYLLTKYGPRSRWGQGLVLERGAGEEEPPAAVQVTRNAPQGATQQERLRHLVGTVGVARTPLRPAGVALFERARVDVVTEGERIDAGARVEVVAVEGNRVVVRAVCV